ncbi:GNAT family N-acetyltransferase [Roseateles amylovorans]|uniref:GNAT family N-acetyltransferase n=1 Tax=Roseateles amylovorans TaxID=2978473 RepID=A0ABY6AXL9_9BURK|nr:GNAT family N-acetyltransferase [Roseateles amylovorans]UXH77325.1 GNAT family N-acetyltransferase [Roseateles amylovorans]
MQIQALDPRSEAALSLLAQSDAYMAALYPQESNHLETPQSLAQPHVHFIGVWLAEWLAGCGAVKVIEDEHGAYGEIKRVFVQPQFRGRGISKVVMEQLEIHLRAKGISLARLETGVHQPEALALYEGLGYDRREPFGPYAPDPLSVFMEKRLSA